MYRAVHADRSGRILVADHAALAFDGARFVPFADAIPLPPDAVVVPIEREAYASERSGKPRRLGAGRLTAAALLPPGYLRTLLPAYVDTTGRPDLAPRPYAAVAADDAGALVTAAIHLESDAMHDPAAYARAETAARVAEGLRTHPGERLWRQLARCAKEYGCHGAANAFRGRWECAIPLAAPANEHPAAALAPKRDGEADPTETAAFHPTTDEVVGAAAAHFAAGGTMVAFGRACEGEPLLAARDVEEAVKRIRASSPAAIVHLGTNGSLPTGIRRIAAAGLDSICIRLMSARAAQYDALHAPEGYRFPDVRASIRVAAELRLAVSVLVLVLPGLLDRPDELDALIDLAGDLPKGSALLLRDLHCDPLRALALVPERVLEPTGIARATLRLRDEVRHVRLGAFVHSMARVPNVP